MDLWISGQPTQSASAKAFKLRDELKEKNNHLVPVPRKYPIIR